MTIHHHHPERVERIIERTYFEGYQGERGPEDVRHTGPIVVPVPVPSPTQPGPEKIIVVQQPPIQQRGTRDEQFEAEPSPLAPRDQKERAGYSPRARHDPRPSEPIDRAPISAQPDPEREQKEFAGPNKKSSDEPIKTIREPDKNNSPTELFEPDKPAPQADVDDFKKVGKVGRQRKYDEIGINDIEPVRELVLFRHQFGEHWPGISQDMKDYYEFWYFTKPNKRKEKKDDYERHVKCWQRRERWLNPTGETQPA